MTQNPDEPLLYYFNEEGYLVMTEAYHLKRGVCCGSACKHCPFDWENVEEVDKE